MKKRIALILSVLMVLTMIPTSVFADDHLVGTEKAKLELVYMKYKDGVTEDMENWEITGLDENQLNVEPTSIGELQVGDTFLVGVKMKDFQNVKQVADGNLLYTMQATVVYDSTYLTAEGVGASDAKDKFSDLSPKRIGSKQGIFKTSAKNGNYVFDTMGISENGENSTVVIPITFNKPTDKMPTYPSASFDDEQYIGAIMFEVKAIPEGGKKVLSLGYATGQNSCSFGIGGTVTYNSGVVDNPAESIIDYIDSGVNIFPKKAAPLGGTASITGTTTYGETLEVDVTQVTGTTNFKYQWTDGTNNIAGATNKTFKVDKPALVGKTLKCVVSPADPTEASGSVTATAGTAIGKKELTVSGTTVANKTFDNKTAAVTSGTILSGKVNTSDKADVNVKANFENATAGTGKNVKVDYTLSGADAGAYTLDKTTETLTADITKAQLTVGTENKTIKVGADVQLSGKVTGAVTGAEPEMAYTYAVKDGSNDVITVSGNQAHGVAAGSKVVTVTGTIKDTTNYEFAAGKNTAEATVTVSEKAATGITIKTQPTKLAYEAGEALDLSGLTVTVTYDDGSNEVVAAADFAGNSITATPADGTTLTIADHNGKPVTVTVGTKSAKTNNLTVVAAATRVTLTTKGAATKAYDNSTAFGRATWTTEPEFESNNGTVDTSKAVYTFADKNAGSCEITVTGLTVNGAPASISGPVADGTITKATPTLVVGNVSQKVGSVTALTTTTDPEDALATADKFTYKIDMKTTAGAIAWDLDKVNSLQAGKYKVEVAYAGSDNTNATTGSAVLVLTKKSSGGGGSSVREYTVRFLAGEHGTIDGKTSVSVEKDAKLKSSDVPTVKAEEGYKFIGWSLDGKTVVNPTKEAVTGSLTYTALYQESHAHKTYMSGYSDGTFRPDGRTTRAEVASLMAGLIDGFDKDAAYNSTLNDIEDAAWYAQAVKFMSQKGLISGYDDGSYRPNNQITRQEFCAIIAKYMGLSAAGTANFNDVADAWGQGFIAQLSAKGIINGYPDGSFRPDQAITRAEVVTILNKVFDRTPDAELVDENIGNYTVRLSDVSKNHWAYTQILEAAIEHETADFHK